MAHHRRSHKAHRKGRKTHHKGRKTHRRSAHRKSRSSHRRHSQRGGASCSAQPLFNRSMFSQQGGMAPIAAGDAYLIDAASRVQAQTAPLDGAFSELPSVIPTRQAGGRRHRHRRSHKVRKSHRHSRKGHKGRKSQRGGALAGFNDPYMLGVDIAKSGSNPQFLDYLPAKGAQA